jgi:hypothetical protein
MSGRMAGGCLYRSVSREVSALVVAASPIDLKTAAHSEMVDYARLPLRVL